MSTNPFRLANHYIPMQRRIFDDCEDIGQLYEEQGEHLTECLFLSCLVENLESQSCAENLLAIAHQLFNFELPPFQPTQLIPIYSGQGLFQGEIVYFSDNALVLKVSTYQFPTWQLLLTIVIRETFTLIPNIYSQTIFEFSGVTL
ncbi:hypothetical protein ACPV5Q_01625 [Vibrio astriarenae]